MRRIEAAINIHTDPNRTTSSEITNITQIDFRTGQKVKKIAFISGNLPIIEPSNILLLRNREYHPKFLPVREMQEPDVYNPNQNSPIDISEFRRRKHPKVVTEIPNLEEIAKVNAYNPGREAKKYLDDFRKLTRRIRRRSRCDGVHDAKEKPCGSPRCRTKGRVELKVQTSNPQKGEIRAKTRKNILRKLQKTSRS